MVLPTKGIAPYEPATFARETRKIQCRDGSTISWKVFRDIVSESSHIVEIQGEEASINFLSRNVHGVFEEQQGGQCEWSRENERKVG